MKIRHASQTGDVKSDTEMTPMIDVVFLLLIYFLVQFKIVAQEGDFDVLMPPPTSEGAASAAQSARVIIDCDDGGNLTQVVYERGFDAQGVPVRIVVPGDTASDKFRALRQFVSEDAGGAADGANFEFEVEITFMDRLRYEHVIDALSHVSGRVVDGQVVEMVEKIRFGPHPDEAE